MVRTPSTLASKGGRTPGASTPGGPKAREENIYVTVRVRPLNRKEQALNDKIVWDCKDEHTLLLKHTNHEQSTTPYTFDRVFDPTCITQKVYDEGAMDVALSPLTGINATIFAYGQTSSGKTFTMRGITENAVKDIYEHIRNTPERIFVLKFSALEIYNETVIDLLNQESGPLRLLDDPERGIIVDKLVEEVANDRNHLRNLIGICEAQRQVGETALNDTSSRSHDSHQIIKLTVESCLRENSSHVKSFIASLNLVDLAGSERASQTDVDGLRLKEGSHINRSLLTLATVIRKLSGGKRIGHIPYRDSKLTRILQPSLGGNSRTAIICTMSPALTHVDQSRNTLSFATRAKEVTNSAQVNMGEIFVEKPVEEVANDSSHLMRLVGTCEAQMQVGETSLKDKNSKSHQITRLLLTEHKKATSDVGYWADLPYHLLTLICSSLHGIDSVRFRLTCPEWKDPSIPIIRSGLPPLESGCPLGSCPFFMHFSGHRTEKYRFFQPLTGEVYEEEHFLQLVDSPTIRCCKFGWLLMGRSSSSLYFLNPFILPAKHIELPLSECNLYMQSSTFTAPPTSPNCRVIIVGSTFDIITACTCRRGDSKWRIQHIKLRLPFQVAPCSPVMIGDFFFLLDTTGNLAAYMIHEDGEIIFAFSGGPKGPDIAALVSTWYIAECRGTVLVVVVGLDYGTSIQVFELNCQGPELFWMPLKTVGGILFLSEGSSVLVSSDAIGVEDRLYFKMVTAETHNDKKGKHHLQECVFYALEVQRYIGLWTGLNSKDELDIKNFPLYMATWIQPKELKELTEQQFDWSTHYNEEEDAEENNQWQGVLTESILRWFVGGIWGREH